MFSWVKQEQGGRNKDGEMYQTVTEGLQTLYTKKLLPLEETYLFHDFHSPALEAADFQSKPMVLLVGQYSTGKTTFIRYRTRGPLSVYLSVWTDHVVPTSLQNRDALLSFLQI